MKEKKIKVLLWFLVATITFFVLVWIAVRGWVYLQYNSKGNILTLAWSLERIYEITQSRLVVWEYRLPAPDTERRDRAPIIKRVKDGSTIIWDGSLHSIYAINRSGEVIWECDSVWWDHGETIDLGWPMSFQELENGNILIKDADRKRLIEVNDRCQAEWIFPRSTEVPWTHIWLARRFRDSNTGILVLYPDTSSALKWPWEYRPWEPHCEYLEINMAGEILTRRTLELAKFHVFINMGEILENRSMLLCSDKYGLVELDSLGNLVWQKTLPDSVTTTEHSAPPKVPAPPAYAHRLQNGETLAWSFRTYLISKEKGIIWRMSDPGVRSFLGIKYLKETEEPSVNRVGYTAEIIE